MYKKKNLLTFSKAFISRQIYTYTKHTYNTHIYLQITSFLWPKRICWFKFSNTFDLPDSLFQQIIIHQEAYKYIFQNNLTLTEFFLQDKQVFAHFLFVWWDKKAKATIFFYYPER